MEFADIIDMMLALITDYGVADMSDEELQADVAVRVNMVIVRAQIPNLAYEDGALTRSATVLEATIIAYGLGAYFCYNGELTVPELVQFTLYLNLFQGPLTNIGNMINNFYQSLIFETFFNFSIF